MLLTLVALIPTGQPLIAGAPTRLPEIAATPALPEPIYWKQEMFLVPYQWSSATEAGAASAVWLYVSKDRGVTWQKISEARPQVTSFNYRAEGDGEYWFAIRTLDMLGRAWPAGPYQPELRVIVDTTMPRISELTAEPLDHGPIEISWRGSDANLDPTSLRIEAQLDAAGTWEPVPAEQVAVAPPNTYSSAGTATHVHAGRTQWTPPPGSRPLAIRATVLDLAGNPATYQTPITPPAGPRFAAPPPTTTFAAPSTSSDVPSPPAGWVSGAAAATQSAALPASQPWPATVAQRAPFRLFSEGPSLPDDGITAYGNPPNITTQQSPSDALVAGSQPTTAPLASGVAALQPFRQASVSRVPSSTARESAVAAAPPGHAYTGAPQHTPPMPPKLVGSRTFALEYDLDAAARWGVTKVELWGTRDGGQTWNRFARDDDHRSPIVVTVDEEGLYGFRIVVETAGTVAQSPEPGDEPELWVAVDLHRPSIELTAIERGAGNLSDHLILRWQAADDNLEPRPISLFYSSRPVGPWSAIATNLEDTGEYAWRVQRYVPERFFLRVEARDTAGNLAAFQTREPIELTASDPTARLLDADVTVPAAAGADASYR